MAAGPFLDGVNDESHTTLTEHVWLNWRDNEQILVLQDKRWQG